MRKKKYHGTALFGVLLLRWNKITGSNQTHTRDEIVGLWTGQEDKNNRLEPKCAFVYVDVANPRQVISL